jgi:hypothetical protein
MIIYKNSIEFLKERFDNGGPDVRRWVLKELRLRWTEVDHDWQQKLSIFRNVYPATYPQRP